METTIENKESTRWYWQPVVEIVIVIVSILGTTLPLYLHTDSKIQAIHQEIKEQNARTDRLYEMFIDLVKERK